MNSPSLENNYVIVCKYYAFEHLSCDIFGDFSIFSLISGKIPHGASHSISFDVTQLDFQKKIGNVQSILEQVLTDL